MRSLKEVHTSDTCYRQEPQSAHHSDTCYRQTGSSQKLTSVNKDLRDKKDPGSPKYASTINGGGDSNFEVEKPVDTIFCFVFVCQDSVYMCSPG